MSVPARLLLQNAAAPGHRQRCRQPGAVLGEIQADQMIFRLAEGGTTGRKAGTFTEQDCLVIANSFWHLSSEGLEGEWRRAVINFGFDADDHGGAGQIDREGQAIGGVDNEVLTGQCRTCVVGSREAVEVIGGARVGEASGGHWLSVNDGPTLIDPTCR